MNELEQVYYVYYKRKYPKNSIYKSIRRDELYFTSNKDDVYKITSKDAIENRYLNDDNLWEEDLMKQCFAGKIDKPTTDLDILQKKATSFIVPINIKPSRCLSHYDYECEYIFESKEEIDRMVARNAKPIIKEYEDIEIYFK